MLRARCSITWAWGDFYRFFRPMQNIEVAASWESDDAQYIEHQPTHIDDNWAIDITLPKVKIRSGYIFWGSHEAPIEVATTKEFIPRPSARVQEIVDQFSEQHLKNAIGFHLRRTDNKVSALNSPDALFIECAEHVVSSGAKIFLATDNVATEAEMKRLFRDSVVTFPKRQKLDERWPRPFDPIAMEDDLTDLFLLSKTRYVVGSYWSSFSQIAMALNGSPECRVLKAE